MLDTLDMGWVGRYMWVGWVDIDRLGWYTEMGYTRLGGIAACMYYI